MAVVEIAYVPTHMLYEGHTALEYDLYLLLQRKGAADSWVCIKQAELAAALARSLSSIRRALRRLAADGYVVIRHRVMLGGQFCTTVYRARLGQYRESSPPQQDIEGGGHALATSRQSGAHVLRVQAR